MLNNVRVFTFQQDNTKSKQNEDCYSVVTFKHTWSFAVADGVSRTQSTDQPKELVSSSIAAKTFCDNVGLLLANGKSLHKAFTRANAQIGNINKKAGVTRQSVDYLCHDYLCCVGIAGVWMEEYPNKFVYGYIGDCSILVYDVNYFPVFLSENTLGVLEQFREGWGFTNKNEKMMFWRKQLRNRAARFMTYGALTGESSALSRVQCGYIDLKPSDTIVLFSDGIYPFIFDLNFRITVANLLKEPFWSEEKHEKMEEYMETETRVLNKRGVGNLDDDRTLIALSFS